LDAVAQVELCQHRPDVALDGRFADDQPGRDLAVGEPARDELERLALARGECSASASASAAAGAGAARGAALVATCSISRRVIEGESSASPAWTVRIASSSCAREACLSRKP